MIWGKTTEQKLERIYSFHKWFAWYPVELENGQWCWWEYVWQCKEEHRGGSEMIRKPFILNEVKPE